MVGEALCKTERECLWLEILLCCGSWWASERSWSSCNKRFLQSIQHKPRRWEEAGAGLCRLSWSLESHFCVCVLQLLQEGRECGSWSLWDVCVGDPSSLCPWDVIPWTFHGCPRVQRGQRMLQNAQDSVILGWWCSFPPFAVENRRFPNLSALSSVARGSLGVEKSKAPVPGGFSGWEALGCSALAQRWVLHPSGGGG